jgi:hypothetical protein
MTDTEGPDCFLEEATNGTEKWPGSVSATSVISCKKARRIPSAAEPPPNPEMRFLTQSPPWMQCLCARNVRPKNSDQDFGAACEDFDLK